MHELFFKNEVYKIVAAAMEVSNELGCGFLEKVYENALLDELSDMNISMEQQLKFDVIYKNRIVGEYIPDVVIDKKIIVEVKAINAIGTKERAQIINYLKVTGCKLGLIINFGNSRMEWERFVL